MQWCTTWVVGTLSYNSANKVYLNFRNNLITLIKYLPAKDLFPVLFIRFLLDGMAGIRFLIKLELANTFAIIKAHFYIYGHLRTYLQKKKKCVCQF